MLAFATIVLDGHRPRSHEIPYSFVRLVRDPHRRQLAGTQQPAQRLCVSPVGLDPVARPAWDQRRRHHGAFMAKRSDLPVQPIPGRTRLVAEVNRLVAVHHLPDQLDHPVRCVVELAKITDLAIPAALRYRDGVPCFRGIDPNKFLPMSLHGSSPMR